MLQQKPRLRMRNNTDTRTVTLLHPFKRHGYQIVSNDEIKRSESFVGLLQHKRGKFIQYGGLCKKNADEWLDLLQLGV